jgi:hypothetical protein
MVTHFSTLLTSLFTHRDKPAAHQALQLIGSHLRYLSRNLPTNPLVVLLNSTTSADTPSTDGTGGARAPLDPVLCSIFNSPTLPLPGYHVDARLARRNKPSFGVVFAQLLDLHLLASRVPRGKEDADVVFAAGTSRAGEHEGARFVTVVEVLLDNMGIWEGKLGPRRNREQRWSAVRVADGRVVDAVQGLRADEARSTSYGEIRLAAGFGGPRV